MPKVFSSANNKRNRKLQHFSQKLSLFKNFFLKQLSTIDFYILTKSITSQTINRCRNRYTLNKKSYLQWREIATYLYSQLMKLLLPSRSMNYPRKNLIYLQQVYTSIQQDKTQKSEIFTAFEKIHCSFLNYLKSEQTNSQIKTLSRILLILIFTTTNLLQVYLINIASCETLEKIKISF